MVARGEFLNTRSELLERRQVNLERELLAELPRLEKAMLKALKRGERGFYYLFNTIHSKELLGILNARHSEYRVRNTDAKYLPRTTEVYLWIQ